MKVNSTSECSGARGERGQEAEGHVAKEGRGQVGVRWPLGCFQVLLKLVAPSTSEARVTAAASAGIVAGIQHPLAENLTDSVRQMLLAMLPEAGGFGSSCKGCKGPSRPKS